MTTITISFDADGTVEYTRTKALTLFGGEGTMERVTDIAKFKHGNLYYINWLMGPYANMAHTCSMATNYNVAIPPRPEGDDAISPIVTFSSYEAAVAHEIEMLNAMRKVGVRFGEQAI